MVATGAKLRALRSLRYDPPGYAKKGARRTTFQTSLEQGEQFLQAAKVAGYSTRPVQLFYALSQAGRAITAASPRVGNQEWKVGGHGLSVQPADRASEVTVTASGSGLFATVASALGVEPFTPREQIALHELWPILPETAFNPLTSDFMFPALLFFQQGWPEEERFSSARVSWIPPAVKGLCGDDPGRVVEYLARYPALRGSSPTLSRPMRHVPWSSAGPGLTLNVEWRGEPPQLPALDTKTLREIGIVSYRSADDLLATPTVGSMSTGLHPFLALWATLLALSSLARYEPAKWSTVLDVDRSPEASSIEHLLDESVESIPAAVLNILTSIQQRTQ
ncbi:MAG TPA: YaaC family protein [Pseudonocardiaceae bacterium]